MRLNNLTGKRFGRLVVLEKAPSKNKRTMWKCQCDCGTIKNISAIGLVKGTTKSCGCYNLEKLRERATHNMSKSRLYRIWRCMKYRCNGKKYAQSYLYKDRGIKLYEPWNDFNNFYEWAKDKYFEGSSIDRIDTNGNYEPSNCRFTDKYIQANNKRNNIIIEYKGKKQTLAQWSKETGINYFCLRDRYLHGWSVERMLTEESIIGKNQFSCKK